MGIVNTQNETNLKQLLSQTPVNTVLTAKYLSSLGFSYSMLKGYEKNGWLRRICQGAYTVLESKAEINGAIYAIQKQLELSIHIGGITALNDYYKIMHNLPFERRLQLFGYRGEKLPKWFRALYNNTELNLTVFLPKDIGYIEQNHGHFKTKISSLERSVLEMLYLVPEKITINEAYQIMEALISAKPKNFQILLEQCSSIKVKRMFLYIAEKINHSWFKRLDLSKIDIGKGTREITKGGKYNKKYNIIIGDIEKI